MCRRECLPFWKRYKTAVKTCIMQQAAAVFTSPGQTFLLSALQIYINTSALDTVTCPYANVGTAVLLMSSRPRRENQFLARL